MHTLIPLLKVYLLNAYFTHSLAILKFALLTKKFTALKT